MPQTLLVGQVASGVPGAEVWYLAEETYGQQGGIGTVGYMVLQDQDRAPVGKNGKLILRRVYWPFAYTGRCVLKVTPIVDFDWNGAPTVVGFSAPAKRRIAVIEAESGQLGTFISSRLEVLDYTGRIEFFTPEYAIKVVAEAAMAIVGPD